MKINIHIEADSVEEAKNALAQLGGGTATLTTSSAPAVGETSSPAQIEKPKTRGSKAATAESAKPEATVVPLNAPAADPLASSPATGTADPLGVTPAADPLATPSAQVSADPLGAPAPVSDPLATPAAVTPQTTAAPATTATPDKIDISAIRAKIGALGGEKKQQCKDLIATFKKADGTPCEKPSDLQEADYQAVYDDLDYV